MFPQAGQDTGGTAWTYSTTDQQNDFGEELWSVYHPTVGNGKVPADQMDTDRSTSQENTEPHTDSRFIYQTFFGHLS